MAMQLLLLSRFSHVRLCNPIDGSPPGSSVPGILQARTLEWVAISFSNAFRHAKSLQLHPTLCASTDGSPPGFSVPGILQVRILEWVAISFSNAFMHAKSLQLYPTCLITLYKYVSFFFSEMISSNSTFKKLRSWHLVPSLHGK